MDKALASPGSGQVFKTGTGTEGEAVAPLFARATRQYCVPAAIPPQILVRQVWPTEQLTCLPSSRSVSAVIVAHF